MRLFKVFSLLCFFTIQILAQTGYNTLGTWNSSGVPNYLTEPGDVISSDLLERIAASLPESKQLPSTHPEYLVDGVATNIVLKEEADVWVTYVTEGASYKNILGYYTYDKNNPPTQISDIKNTMAIVFPNVSNVNSGGGLAPGDKVYLGSFPANTVIGYFLLANGWKNEKVTDGLWRLFSNSNLNPENDKSLRQHNVILNDNGNRAILGFEDIQRESSSCDHDFNDALFYVTASPKEAIDYEDIPDAEDPGDDDICMDYTITFDGVQNDYDKNTSTWAYTVSTVGSAKDLSHWVLGLCAGHKVLDSNYEGWEVPTNGDPTTGVYGIKWDKGLRVGKTDTYTFTLQGIYPVENVLVAVKTGGRAKTEVCETLGPGCAEEVSSVDIEINKSVNKDCLADGETVAYTVIVKNNGPDNATNVVVSDILPLGLTNFSIKVSQGSFDYTTGIWSVGSIANGGSETLEVSARVEKSQITSASVELGAASDFNLFVFDDFTVSNSDIEGKAAVGGNASFENYSVGTKLTVDNEDVLIVGSNLTFNNGSVYHGNVVYGGTTNLPQGNVNIAGVLRKANPINFDAAKTQLQTLSTNLSNLLVNGTTEVLYNSSLILTGTDPLLNIFKVTKTQMNGTSELKINVPDGASVIVNVDGTGATFDGGLQLNGADKSDVIYNFYNAVELNINGISVKGSILAPFAAITFNSGNIDGQLIAKSAQGYGEYHLVKFDGSIPETEITIVNTASLVSVDQEDSDDSNNSSSVETPFCETPDEDKIDLAITKAISSNGCYKDGDEVVFNIEVTNAGPETATNVVVTDVLAAGLTNAYYTASQGTYTIANGQWVVGTLALGASATLQITTTLDFESVDPDDLTDRKILNVAAIENYDQIETNNENNTASVEVILCEEPTEVDIEIKKSVNNKTPNDGDIVTFTIVATNNGPADATGVKVSEIIPQGLKNITATPSQGKYTFATGLWNVGSLANGASATLTIEATVGLEPVYNEVYDLGPAKGFNLFVLRDVTQPSSDTEGKVAVGRNFSVDNYSVGDKLPNSNGTEDVLIVGGHLEFIGGDVFGGNVVFGNTTNLPSDLVGIVNGTLRKDNPIDFTAAGTYLRSLSTTLQGKIVNGTTTLDWSALVLKGTDPFVNVFEVTADQLNESTEVKISAPNGSVVIVNILGNNIKWSGGLVVVGTSTTNVLYNFPQATEIQINNIDVTGSILAPRAHVNFKSGVQNGQMIAKSVEGEGQYNNVLFLGQIPSEGNILNSASLISVEQAETNADNNYGEVKLVVTYNSDPNNSSTGSNTEWKSVAEFASSEIIWTMTAGLEGSPIAGTWGGNIYKYDGTTWNKINEGMGVGYVWSIVCNQANQKIYASTERGVFVSSNNGVSWSSAGLTDFDVRALTIDNNGVLYAGTWGSGLYKLGASDWEQIEMEVANTSIHALAVSTSNEIYVGTFGSGILKYANGVWKTLEVGYDYIWALGISPSGKIYAGTYGVGVMASPDDGETWYLLNSGVEGDYVYSVSISSSTVSISTWSGGVYTIIESEGLQKITSAVDFGEWVTFGLEGKGVSSLYTDIENNTMYAGTKNGQIYKVINGVTDVISDNKIIPTSFALEQNYPNPFNPVTNINFSIAQAGDYKLSVYNVLGQLVATIKEGMINPGNYQVQFNASKFSSGVYFYYLKGDNGVNLVKKMMLLK